MLYLTGHRERFQYLDFVYYVLKTQEIVPEGFEVDHKAKKKGKLTAEQQLYPFVQSLLSSGEEIQELNNFIFSVIDAHFAAPKKTLFKFHPVLVEDYKEKRSEASVSSPVGFSAPPPPPPPSF